MKTFSIHALELGPMENFIYIIQDHSSKTAAVVDPAWEIAKIIALSDHQGFKITDVLLTHSHYDHTDGLQELLEKTDAEVHLSEIEAEFWDKKLNNPILHKEGDIIQLGTTKINVLHTPGHTPGSVCYHMDEHLITGDTLFVNACGRCDLPGGNLQQMQQSLHRLGNLPPETIIHPGHHYGPQASSTIGDQLKNNPFMQ
ncbi:MBL fold metallo-hydrolase [Candidatus Halobeggiatoa sp. HSG11]|nr:MBL fold metallo-hydrolase [Candidatus Halobeggiatoa sp. HSG11]